MNAEQLLEQGKIKLPTNPILRERVRHSISGKIRYRYGDKYTVRVRGDHAVILKNDMYASPHGREYKKLMEGETLVLPIDQDTSPYYSFFKRHGKQLRTEKISETERKYWVDGIIQE